MITWETSPEIFKLGPIAVRWYSLAFILGFFLGEKYASHYLIKEKGFTKDEVTKLLYYMITGTIIGARLGHCLFYEPGYYLSNPVQILMVWKGGLASHGGFTGVIAALWLFSKYVKSLDFVWLLDLMAPPALLTGAFIRLGNLMNSEILGKPTDGTWGFIFKRVDMIPRHPAQLYESLGFAFVALIGYYLYIKQRQKLKPGFIIGFILFGGFTHRFIVEFFKENQVAFENSMALNMGQLLSIPMILIGIILMFYKSSSHVAKKA